MAEPTSESTRMALYLKNVHKFYGIGRGALHILDGFTMKVPIGNICGLLGASGCGKTTVLRCALGRLPILSGEIYILGKPPGSKGHGVPGKDVGYMPQEEALATEFTIKETMYYFGIIFEMKFRYIQQRTDFLKEFLDLPSLSQLCGTLSGGQKRRVSLACALLHEPRLLMLDEPTAGIDALLRARIWSHLLEMASTGNTTILITTHYIEEARQAHLVSLMRNGKLLTQDKPEDLIQRYNVITLEDVFLKLSEEQEQQLSKGVAKGASIQQVTDEEPGEETPLLAKANVVQKPSYLPTLDFGIPRPPKISKTAALTWKEVLKFVRHPFTFFFVVFNPTIQLLILSITYGTELHGIKVYYTNYDEPYNATHYNISPALTLGTNFISYIDGDTLDLKLASDYNEGVDKIEDGRAWAFFQIPVNYSERYVNRLLDACESVEHRMPPESDLSGAAIELAIDATSQRITFAILDELNKAAVLMRNDFISQTNILPSYFTPPIKIDQYVYGSEDFEVTDFFIPGLLAGIALAISMALTSLNLIIERKSGLFDRSWVAGVNVMEVIASQMLAYSVIACIQAAILTVFGIYVVNVEREGSVILAYILICLVGMTGVALGLVLSAYLGTEDASLQTTLGLVYPLYLTGGIYWPVQSFPPWGRVASHLGPLTYPAEGVRAILAKDFGIGDDPVYFGFIAPTVWLIIFVVVASLGVHFRRF